jgi:hypothetical protein
MSQLIARLILAMLTLPLAGIVFVLGMLPLTQTPGAPPGLAIAAVWALTSIFVFVYWIVLWRRMVQWSRARIIKTYIAIAASCAVSISLFVIIRAVVASIPDGPIALLTGGLTPLVFVTTTVFIWRETGEERQARIAARGFETVACLTCGYNLTGLCEARCPECGATFTLEALLAGQRDDAERELASAQ